MKRWGERGRGVMKRWGEKGVGCNEEMGRREGGLRDGEKGDGV